MRKKDDSAQMILIASFAIGMAVVVLTLMLNSIIFASNTASESNVETNVYDYSNAVQITVDAYEKAYSYSYNGSVNNTEFNDYIDAFSRKMTESSAFSGVIYTLEHGNFHKPYFTQNGLIDGNVNWTVIERVNYTDTFLMAINSSAFSNSTQFSVEAFNQSGTIWSAEFEKSGTGVNISVTDGLTVLDTYSSSSGELNISSDLVDGSSYFNYYFNNKTAGKTYSLRIINGNVTTGTFLIAGDTVSGNKFEIERIDVIKARIEMNKNGNLKMDALIPITLPKGQA
ncbi:hypothetical protein MettiDRAFT_1729 [Methanolobus tindarius DSM 2278]|uniref:Uncharacterized protein n=1 Tax=Methanolobus tindarius DSM 2278 TaxID=1090322 RepID=W9DXX5_METTI|nr:hypothetical protein [Methanolobus tindarius]ETA68271.1 hypothetical protein MettiDRAFT_1729 [Methanolobus tindarius DSM 2278]